MTWRERRRYCHAVERRVLAGEPKAALLAELTAAGDDRGAAARALARAVSPPRRRRYRWAQRLFVALVVAAGVTAALSPLVNPSSDGPWFVIGIIFIVLLFGTPLTSVLRWHTDGYVGAGTAAVITFWLTIRPLLDDLSQFSLGAALVLALYAAVLVVGIVLWRRLFPNVGWAGEPRTNADGEYLLVE